MTDKDILSEVKAALKCESYVDLSRIAGVGYSTLMNISTGRYSIGNMVAKKLYAVHPHEGLRQRADVIIGVKPKRPELPKQPKQLVVVAPEPIIPAIAPAARIAHDNASPEGRKVHFIPDGKGKASGLYFVIETAIHAGKKALSVRRIGHGTGDFPPLEVSFKEQTIHIR